MNRQSVTGIGGTDKRAPGDRPQIEFLHDTPDTLGVGSDAGPLQMPCDAAVAVAGKLPMYSFNLMTKLFILVVDNLLMLFVGAVVIAARRQSAYFAGFRN
jgi:hypothetical protein